MDFNRRFPDEKSCWEALVHARWPQEVHCPRCGREMNFNANRAIFNCSGCGKQLSATSGTIFHKSRLPLKAWFQAMQWMLNSPNGISTLELQKRLHLKSYRAAWLLAHKIRSVMLPRKEAPHWLETAEHSRFIARGRPRPGTPHGWSSKYHRAYAAESAYRIRRKQNTPAAFDQLLADCIATSSVTLRDITA